MTRGRGRSVAQQMFAWQLLVIVVLVAGGVSLAWLDARQHSRSTAREQALDVARTVAAAPTVTTALASPDPSATLQPFAEAVRKETTTDFVVIMNTRGIRFSHPDPANIGKEFIGHITPAVDGRPFTEDYTGTLGRSVRAVVPVRRGTTVVGLVAVGITNQKVDHEVISALPRLVAAAVGAGLLGAFGVWLVNRRLRRQTHGLGEQEITRMYEYYDAVLRAVREGLLLLDPAGRVTLANDESRRLLDLEQDPVGRSFTDLGLTPGLCADLVSGVRRADAIHVVGDRVLVVSQAPARWNGRDVGSVVTLRDRTDLQSVTAELDTVRGLADALRSQNHESTNRLHTMVSLIEIGHPDEAVDFATRELDVARQLTDRMVESVDEPVIAALLMGKSAQAAERGVDLTISPATSVTGLLLTPHEAVTVLGNLVDNAIDAAQGSAASTVTVTLRSSATTWRLRVDDSGPGVAPADDDAVFVRGWSTKPTEGAGRGIGLALVGQVAARHGGLASVGASDLGGASFEVVIDASDQVAR